MGGNPFDISMFLTPNAVQVVEDATEQSQTGWSKPTEPRQPAVVIAVLAPVSASPVAKMKRPPAVVVLSLRAPLKGCAKRKTTQPLP
jgi:hypothetical protein